jgi:hypothetical protein
MSDDDRVPVDEVTEPDGDDTVHIPADEGGDEGGN